MNQPPNTVLRFEDCDQQSLTDLLRRYGMQVEQAAKGQDIRGSFWGEEEAGLVGHRVVVRSDTPVHSILHEACHYEYIDGQRRSGLDTNAGGDYDEENAVCYLQIILADELNGMSRQRMFDDMDAWGYSFRLGSARAWFERDAEDAQQWLRSSSLIDRENNATFQLHP